MVGLLTDVGNALTPYFVQPGDSIMILGTTTGHLGGSALWKYVLKTLGGPPPPVDLDQESKLIQVLVSVAEAGLVSSAHDVGDGGVAVCLAPVQATLRAASATADLAPSYGSSDM